MTPSPSKGTIMSNNNDDIVDLIITLVLSVFGIALMYDSIKRIFY